MDERYEPITDWRNIGYWFETALYPDFGIRTPWGNLIFKPWSKRRFSERYGYRPALRFFGVCVTWVRLKQFSPPPQQ